MLLSAAKRSLLLPTNVSASGRRSIANAVQSFLHGSPDAKEAGEMEVQQHGRLVARGKYVHLIEVHSVKPGAIAQYKHAAEQYYTGLAEDERLKIKLTGDWETMVGDQDSFFHITQYENYAGVDKSLALLRKVGEKHLQAYHEMLPHLNSRSSSINQEFSFFPTASPHTEGGIFELRSYQLKPGTLLEWENTWRAGIDARRKFVEPVGAWFSQVGRLHRVYHLWQYPDLHTRKATREKAWQLDGWAETVSKTAQLAKTMDSFILTPLPFSPLK